MHVYIYPRLLSPREADILFNKIHELSVYRAQYAKTFIRKFYVFCKTHRTYICIRHIESVAKTRYYVSQTYRTIFRGYIFS